MSESIAKARADWKETVQSQSAALEEFTASKIAECDRAEEV